MVNSATFDTNASIGQGDRNTPKVCMHQNQNNAVDTSTRSTVSRSSQRQKTNIVEGEVVSTSVAQAPVASKSESVENVAENAVLGENSSVSEEDNNTLCCSVPLDKVQVVLSTIHQSKCDEPKPTRKLLCLYCERSFASANLRQKHVERIHSLKKNRRLSSRKQQLTATPCIYCEKLNNSEYTLKNLFQHLVNEHSNNYYGCFLCEERFLTNTLLNDHNAALHPTVEIAKTTIKVTQSEDEEEEEEEVEKEQASVKLTRSRAKHKAELADNSKKLVVRNKNTKLKELRSKKLTVKSSRIALNRRESKRLQALAKLTEAQKKKRPKTVDRKQTNASKSEPIQEKAKPTSICDNPYPEFDHFYRVKKITDHSIDNLKISSLTFDDVFDKAFFNRIKCNIEENLLHHIDGKLFKNEESESRISNFEKVSSIQQEIQNSTSENYGCELSLNAVTPVAALSLNSQFGEDFESQIEYGSKPSKKKTQTKKDEVHYKYFTRRKFQASILEHKENRDLSKLDMWTQLVIKKRQQKIIDDKKTAKETLEYTTSDEYKNKVRREELNRILDRRGPFEDLREESSKKAALDKLNSASEDSISQESFTDVREVLNEILDRVFTVTEEPNVLDSKSNTQSTPSVEEFNTKLDLREIPSFLNLRRSSSLLTEGELDQSDKISLICSSQETENFELPTNAARGKNELIEISGEWARCRLYICAACGAKLPNMKSLLDHKTIYHQNVWVQHYEFVGNQSELYRHLSIPALGKVGYIEDNVVCKVWKRSDARLCSKCNKQCNSLGELHRHILECGGDWTWVMVRKKCKYRYGAKSRRRRRGTVVKVRTKRKTESTQKKTYKYDGPRQRPSDAETIQRMLANLPAKRSTRKLISLYDGVRRKQKTKALENIKQKKVKCGKVIYDKSSNIKETTEKTINAAVPLKKSQKNNKSSNVRTLRSLSRVLSSRILDTNSKLTVKRKLRLNERRRTRQSMMSEEEKEDKAEDTSQPSKETRKNKMDDISPKRTSPRSTKMVRKMKLFTGNINIKSFFPVKKRKDKKESKDDIDSETKDIRTRSKKKSNESEEETKKVEIVEKKAVPKVTKSDRLSTLVRSLSMNKKNSKKTSQDKLSEDVAQDVEKLAPNVEKSASKEDLESTRRKHKLKQSFRNVINRVKRLKIDAAPETVQTQVTDKTQSSSKSPFLDEGKQEKEPPAKIVIPSNIEAKENIADISETAHTVIAFNETNEEDSPVPENIFKLDSNNEKNLQAKGEPNFDTQPVTAEKTPTENLNKETLLKVQDTATLEPITIETSVKSKIVPMISPNIKGKIRKPTRGLNDCIAMLTSKLQQKTTEPVTKAATLLVLPSCNQPKIVTDPTPQTAECILKIPTFKTHNETTEDVALDLSIKSRHQESNQLIPLKLTQTFSSNTKSNFLKVLPWDFSKLTSVERIIENVVSNKLQESQKFRLSPPWNSIDQTIQNVIDGHWKQQKSAQIRTTVDDIIEYVIINNNKSVSSFGQVSNSLDPVKTKEKNKKVVVSVQKFKRNEDTINEFSQQETKLIIENNLEFNKIETKASEIQNNPILQLNRNLDVKPEEVSSIIPMNSTKEKVLKIARKIRQMRKCKKKNDECFDGILDNKLVDIKVPLTLQIHNDSEQTTITEEEEPHIMENKTVFHDISLPSPVKPVELKLSDKSEEDDKFNKSKQNLRNFRKHNKTVLKEKDDAGFNKIDKNKKTEFKIENKPTDINGETKTSSEGLTTNKRLNSEKLICKAVKKAARMKTIDTHKGKVNESDPINRTLLSTDEKTSQETTEIIMATPIKIYDPSVHKNIISFKTKKKKKGSKLRFTKRKTKPLNTLLASSVVTENNDNNQNSVKNCENDLPTENVLTEAVELPENSNTISSTELEKDPKQNNITLKTITHQSKMKTTSILKPAVLSLTSILTKEYPKEIPKSEEKECTTDIETKIPIFELETQNKASEIIDSEKVDKFTKPLGVTPKKKARKTKRFIVPKRKTFKFLPLSYSSESDETSLEHKDIKDVEFQGHEKQSKSKSNESEPIDSVPLLNENIANKQYEVTWQEIRTQIPLINYMSENNEGSITTEASIFKNSKQKKGRSKSLKLDNGTNAPFSKEISAININEEEIAETKNISDTLADTCLDSKRTSPKGKSKAFDQLDTPNESVGLENIPNNSKTAALLDENLINNQNLELSDSITIEDKRKLSKIKSKSSIKPVSASKQDIETEIESDKFVQDSINELNSEEFNFGEQRKLAIRKSKYTKKEANQNMSNSDKEDNLMVEETVSVHLRKTRSMRTISLENLNVTSNENTSSFNNEIVDPTKQPTRSTRSLENLNVIIEEETTIRDIECKTRFKKSRGSLDNLTLEQNTISSEKSNIATKTKILKKSKSFDQGPSLLDDIKTREPSTGIKTRQKKAEDLTEISEKTGHTSPKLVENLEISNANLGSSESKIKSRRTKVLLENMTMVNNLVKENKNSKIPTRTKSFRKTNKTMDNKEIPNVTNEESLVNNIEKGVNSDTKGKSKRLNSPKKILKSNPSLEIDQISDNLLPTEIDINLEYKIKAVIQESNKKLESAHKSNKINDELTPITKSTSILSSEKKQSKVDCSLESLNNAIDDSGFIEQNITPKRKSKTAKQYIDVETKIDNTPPEEEDSIFEDEIRHVPKRVERSQRNKTKEEILQKTLTNVDNSNSDNTVRRTRSSNNLLTSSNESLTKLNDSLDAEVSNIMGYSEFTTPERKISKYSQTRSASLKNIFGTSPFTNSTESQNSLQKSKRLCNKGNKFRKNSFSLSSEESLSSNSENATDFVSHKSIRPLKKSKSLKNVSIPKEIETCASPDTSEGFNKDTIEYDFITKNADKEQSFKESEFVTMDSELIKTPGLSDVELLEEKIRNAIKKSLMSITEPEEDEKYESKTIKHDFDINSLSCISTMTEIKNNEDISIPVDLIINDTEINKPEPAKKSKKNRKSNAYNKCSDSPILSATSMSVVDTDVYTTRSLRRKSAVNYSEIEETKDLNDDIKILDHKTDIESSNIVESKESPTFILDISNSTISEDPKNDLIEDDPKMDEIQLESKENTYVLKENLSKNTLVETNNGINRKRTKLRAKKGNRRFIRKQKSDLIMPENDIVEPIANLSVISENILTVPSSESIIPGVPDTEKEPPIKIIINKHKARRKSKSIKKIGHKGHNNLYEDFSLVFKKKRKAPIITFSPPNAFSKEHTYPLEVHHAHKVLSETEKELDVSVEEMDMELDEIPIKSNIIETPKSDLSQIIELETENESKDNNLCSNSTKKNSKLSGRKKKGKSRNNRNNTFNIMVNENAISIEENVSSEKIEEIPVLKINFKPNTNNDYYYTDIGNGDITIPTSSEVPNNFILNKDDFSSDDFEVDNSFEDSIICEDNTPKKPSVDAETLFNKLIENSEFVKPLILKKNKIFTKKRGKKPKCHLENKLDETTEDETTESELESDVSVNKSIQNIPKYDKSNSPSIPTETDHDNTDEQILNDLKPKTKLTKRCKKRGDRKKIKSKKQQSEDLDISNKDTNIVEELTKEISVLEHKSAFTEEALNSCSKESDTKNDELKKEDIDKLYAFSDTDDFESEKPIELPRRLSRKNENLENPEPQEDITVKDRSLDKTITKKKVKPLVSKNAEKSELNFSGVFNEEIQLKCTKKKTKELSTPIFREETENDINAPAEFETRKIMRNAKVKALESIHDEALAELIDIEIIEDKTTAKEMKINDDSEIKNSNKKGRKTEPTVNTFEFSGDIFANNNLPQTENADQEDKDSATDNILKKSTRRQKKNEKVLQFTESFEFPREVLVNSEAPLLEDLVAELDGLEELENSIERELNAEMNLQKTNEPTIDKPEKEEVKNSYPEESLGNSMTAEENQELRRSRRGSRKVASYNENDLIDPLIDALENKRLSKKKDDKTSQEAKKKKLNSEQLFDLLKTSANDNLYVPKQQNSFLNSLDDSSRDVTDENFDNMFENILEKTAFLTQKKNIDKVYEFAESHDNVDSLNDAPKAKVAKKSRKYEDLESISFGQDSTSESKSKSDKFEPNYCEICSKSFVKLENLLKHRRTLTHIQKLSELEAKEAEKSKIISRHEDENSIESVIEPPLSRENDFEKSDLTIGSLAPKDSIQSPFNTNHSLKLADIISDVLNKPVLPGIDEEPNKFSDIILQNDTNKRYKSLGERKSFDSDSMITTDSHLIEPFQAKTTKTILEKQISLLENMIENQATNNYIDDISLSSEKSDTPSEPSSQQIIKPVTDNDSFLKPTQYEEISEDSANLRNYDDQKLRKTLNRDEELFLECCSLLKSSSEVSSSYSNKKMPEKVAGALGLKPVDEPEWMEKKNLLEKSISNADYSDHSRIPTPLGNSYDDDVSNSNTISSNWAVDKSGEKIKMEVEGTAVRLNFENITAENHQDNNNIRLDVILSNQRTDIFANDNATSHKSNTDELSDGSLIDNKKIITKGARKVFEGLKVSIPTEELNLEEVLNNSPRQKKTEVERNSEEEKLASPSSKRKSKPVKKAQVGSNVLFKVNKKKLSSPTILKDADDSDDKGYDVYDFEETQDNTDIFTKPNYRTFRTTKGDNESENESQETDTFLKPESVTPTPPSSTKKQKAQENITKKKCMIMGRIFKNAAKSKIEDIDVELDNEVLVENYVAECKNVIKNEIHSTETETDIIPEQAVTERQKLDSEKEEKLITKPCKMEPKKQDTKKKVKLKGKKRIRTNSDSTDDEFSLCKTSKRKTNRKNAKEDNCINLEQELKECIGVASRKSQRKCTSGKQNVLVEYWSSDESQFEALLEKQIIEIKPKIPPLEKPLELSIREASPIMEAPAEPKKPIPKKRNSEKKKSKSQDGSIEGSNNSRRKRAAVNPLYHWSSSSEDEANDLIEIKPLRDEIEDDEDRPVQHGWIVGDSPKKLVTMLAQAKGKKADIDCVKEQGKKRTNTVS